MTTTVISELKEKGLLFESSSYLNEDVLKASIVLAYKNGHETNEDIYNAVSKECDMSLQETLNSMFENMEDNNETFVQIAENY